MICDQVLYNTLEVLLNPRLPFVGFVANFVAAEQSTDSIRDLQHHIDNIFFAFDNTGALSEVLGNLSDCVAARVVAVKLKNFGVSVLAAAAKRVCCKRADSIVNYYEPRA
jgi:hypothetical protein